MSDTPPAILIRLREADVVRFCGLESAAAGIEIVRRRLVGDCQRHGALLSAVIHDAEECPVRATLESAGGPVQLQWHCKAHSSSSEISSSEQACPHVAALLTMWIRTPSDFQVASATGAISSEPRPTTPHARLHPPLQQVLVQAERPKRPHTVSTLREELAHMPAQDVTAIARRISGAELDEHEARRVLGVLLADPAQVATIAGRLDVGAHAMLNDLLCMGGAITAMGVDDLAARTGRTPSTVRSWLSVLERHGLVYRATQTTHRAGTSWRDLAGWRIPPEIRDALPRKFPVEPASQQSGIPQVPDTGHPQRRGRLRPASPRALALAVALLMRAGHLYRVDDQAHSGSRERGAPPFPLIPGDLTISRAREFSRAAGVPPGLARLAWRLLLWTRDATTAGAGHSLADINAVPREERFPVLRAAYRAWSSAEAPVELADVPILCPNIAIHFDAQHQSLRPAMLSEEMRNSRTFLLGLLALAQPGDWYLFDDWLAAIWRIQPSYLRSRQSALSTPSWWIERAGSHQRLRTHQRGEWQEGDGAIARALVEGPLHWWGAIDLAVDQNGRAYAFRLTPLGAYLLQSGSEQPRAQSVREDTSAGPAILATRDGAFAVHPLATPADLLRILDQWARVASVAGGRLIYRLAPDLVCQQFDRGAQVDALPALLRATREEGIERVAAAAQTQLERWNAAYGRTSIESGWTVVDVDDPVTLVEALSLLPEHARGSIALGPTAALIPEQVTTALSAALARRGYLT